MKIAKSMPRKSTNISSEEINKISADYIIKILNNFERNNTPLIN